MSLTPATIEDAIVAKLAADAALVAMGVRVELFAADFARARRTTSAAVKLPAILVAYTGSEIKPEGQFTVVDMALFQVSIVARNLRSIRAARATVEDGGGDAVTVGAENILWRVRKLLTGATFELDMGELLPTDIELAEYREDERIVEYVSLWRTRVTFELEDADHEGAGTVADLETVMVELQEDELPIVTDTHDSLQE